MSRHAFVLVALAAALLLPFTSARAQGAEGLCAEQATTPDTTACLQRELAARDRLLAAEFERLRSTWRDRDVQQAMFKVAPALEASQRAWEVYRAQECEARARVYGYGTGAGAESLRCQLALAEQRLEVLSRHWR